MDKRIVAYRHCPGPPQLCYDGDLPLECPRCLRGTDGGFLSPPYPVKAPFQPSQPCSVVVEPARGSYETYRQGHDLHIGITDCTGRVTSFDETGVNLSQLPWQQCVTVYTHRVGGGDGGDDWMRALRSTARRFQHSSYEEVGNNCYAFAIDFLSTLHGASIEKSDFCKEFIQPNMLQAAKYIALYHSLRKTKKEF